MIYIIVAVSRNGVIGRGGKLPWNFKKDFDHFKNLTMGKKIVFGRKTFESLKKPLEGREVIVLTRNQNYLSKICTIKHSYQEIINNYLKSKEICFIGGGEEIYKLFLPYANKIYLTLIHKDFYGDAFFPLKELKKFKSIKSEIVFEKAIKLEFIEFERK